MASLSSAYLSGTHPKVSRVPVQRTAAFARIVLLALALAGTALPAQAFLGLLGKAASGAGKAAAGTAGKTAGVGAAAGAATLADDAARVGGKAAVVEGAAVPPGGGALASGVNAALPPEVAMYLSKPAASLTGTDTAHMMDLYHRMVAQAGKTGDFTVAERLPSTHAAPKTLGSTPAAVPTPATTATAIAPAPASAGTSASAGAEISLHALRLLAHAASAGHRAAQSELRQRCADAVVRKASADLQAQCKASKA
jgi:hypothetical protein